MASNAINQGVIGPGTLSGMTASGIQTLQEAHLRQLAAQMGQYVSSGSQSAPIAASNRIVSDMDVSKISNGLLMRIKIKSNDPWKEIYVESIDKLGEALTQAIIEARIEA